MNYACACRNIADFHSLPPVRAGHLRSRSSAQFFEQEASKYVPVLSPLCGLHELVTPKLFTQRCLELGFTTIPAARPGLFAPTAKAKKRPLVSGGRPSAGSGYDVDVSDTDDLETVTSYEMVELASDRGWANNITGFIVHYIISSFLVSFRASRHESCHVMLESVTVISSQTMIMWCSCSLSRGT